MRRFDCRVLAFFLIWAFALPAWSAPQGASEPPASPRETASTPNVIAVTEVIPSSERALLRLNDIRKVLDADDSARVVEKELPESARKLDEWWDAESKSVHQLKSVQRLNDAAWQLRVYGSQVAGWNELLAASSKKWSSNEKTRSRLIADWQATQAALDPAAPQAVINTIRQVLNEGNSVQRLYQEKTAQLVAVQGQLTARLSKLNEIRDEIEAVRQNSTVDLFERDSPPLWTSLFASESNPSPALLLRDSVKRIVRDGSDFFHLYPARLLLHLVLFLLLTALFFHLRGFAFNAGKEAPTVSEQFILNHSVASAFLVALFCLPLLYPEASPQMTRLILIPAIIPIMVLFPAIFAPRLRMALYFLATVYVVEFWRYYLPPQWSAVRILLLVEALLGIAVLYMNLRLRPADLPVSQFRETVAPVLLKAAMLLFIGAIAANVLGNQTLAEWLFTPLVRTLFLGVVIRTLAVVAITYAVMALRTRLLMSLRTVQNHGPAIAVKMHKLAILGTISFWIATALYNIGAFGIVLKTLEDIFESEWKLGAAEISVREVVIFVVVLWAAFIISRMFRFILTNEIFPRFKMPRGVPDVLELLARYGVLLFGFVFALSSAGANLSQLTFALSALGVGIGFGLQNIVNNFVCGLILVFEHPIQVGDYVEVGPHFGQVNRIGFRSSSLTTPDGGDVIIPNSELIGTRVMNWSLSDQMRRITLRIPVPFGTDPNRVFDIFKTVAHSQPQVAATPVPSAALETLGDSSLTFIVRCWVRTEVFESVKFGLMLAINNAFMEAGIKIPIPKSDVFVHLPEKAGLSMTQAEKLK